MKKIKVFALLTVLLCVFAVSALAIEGVQLWEGGPEYATTTLESPYGTKIYLAEINDSDPSPYWDWCMDNRYTAAELIPTGWHIASMEELTDLFDPANTSYDYQNATYSYLITGKNSKQLTLGPTGYIESPGVPDPDDVNTGYYFTSDGECLYFDSTTTPYERSTAYSGQVILVRDASVTVSFNTNGGSTIEPQTVTPGNTATKPTDPTKTGMTFTGWFTDADCTKAFNFTKAITENTTLYAGWKAAEDKFTVDWAEGSTKTFGKLTFTGDTSDYEYIILYSVNDDNTLKYLTNGNVDYVRNNGGFVYNFEENVKYRVYLSNVYDNPTTAELSINHSSDWLVHTHQFTYTADGAKLTATCKSCPDSLVAELTIAGDDETVYSGSPVTMTLSGNTSTWKDLTGKELPTIEYSDGTNWSTNAPTNVGSYTARIVIESATATKAFDINPKPLNDPSITVTVTPTKATYTGSPIEFKVTVKDGDKVLKAGEDFTVLGSSAGAPDTVTITAAVAYTLTVEGRSNYTDHASPSVEIVPKPITVTPDNQTIVKGDPLPTLTWTCDAELDDELKNTSWSLKTAKGDTAGKFPIEIGGYTGTNYKVTYGTGTLTVLDIFTVTFETNGGSTIPSEEVVEGKTATKPTDPTKTGMTFTGWFTDADCTKAYDFTTPVTANTTLYAGWASIPVTVTFESNGGSAVDAQTVDYGKTATKPTDPTKTGMDFSGWFTDKDCTEAYDFSKTVTTDITLYAGWEIIPLTVTFETNGGTEVPFQTVSYGDTAEEPTAPTKTGMTFTGWFTDADCTKAYDFSSAVTASTTLYAGWEAVTPTPTPTPTPDPDPIIIEGQNSEWNKDTQDSLKFRSDADYELFIRVEVDDKTVDPTNYTSAEGSTIIFLKPSFLQSLAEGKHKLAIVSSYKSGEKKAITSFTIKVPPLPPTGDSTPVALLTLLCFAALGTAGLILKKKKHN